MDRYALSYFFVVVASLLLGCRAEALTPPAATVTSSAVSTPSASDLHPDLVALTERLEVAGLSVKRQTPRQGETLFDRLAGDAVTHREILLLDERLSLDYFRFPEAATADAMSAALQPGGTRFRYTRPTGRTVEESVDIMYPTQGISWWRYKDGMLSLQGNDPTMRDAVTAALGDGSRLDSPPSPPTTVEIRVVNLSQEIFYDVTLRSDRGGHAFNALDRYTVTPYIEMNDFFMLYITRFNDLIELDPTLVAGDTPLLPGQYTFVVGQDGDELRLAMLNDTEPLTPSPYLVGDWVWTEVELADGSRRTPQYQAQPQVLTLTDTPDTAIAGYRYTVTLGCNTSEGAYLPAAAGTLIVMPGPQTPASCPEPIKADEELLAAALSSGFLMLGGDPETLTVRANGHTFTFKRAEPVS